MSTTDPHRYTWPEDTVVEPDGTIVFRPSWENYRAKFLRVPAFLMAIVALNLFRMDDLRLALALLVVSLAGAAAGTALYFRRALTSVGPRGLVRRDLIRNTAVPKERLGEVIFVRELAHYDPRIDTTLIVTDAQGRKVAMFNGPFWSADQLYAMASALQQPTWQPQGPTTFRQVRERYPAAVPLLYARPVLFAFALAGILLGVIITIAVAVVVAA